LGFHLQAIQFAQRIQRRLRPSQNIPKVRKILMANDSRMGLWKEALTARVSREWSFAMKITVLKFATLPLLAALVTMISHAQIGAVKPAGPPKAVQGQGCVWEGVEAGCLMVTDKDTDVLYNLFFRSGEKPQVGTGIFFSGTLHEGATACMQGRPVDVKDWVKRKMNCTAPEKKRVPF
jgi:hypothetical protein